MSLLGVLKIVIRSLIKYRQLRNDQMNYLSSHDFALVPIRITRDILQYNFDSSLF